jgi:hypothetical protein
MTDKTNAGCEKKPDSSDSQIKGSERPTLKKEPGAVIFWRADEKHIGLHGLNMRPNSDNGSGSRGEYALAQVNPEMVERALTTFIGEGANW